MLAHYNLGNALSGIGRYAQAVDAFAAANRIAPEYASAQYNGSLALLALGNFERGFAQYEWRWRATGKQAALDKFKVPQWRGEAIDGKTILIHAEQGMGDCLQFCRYVPLIAARGGQVILSVHPRLKRLLKRLAGALAIVTDGDPVPNFDYHCPMMSLPLAFKTRIATVPAHTPYLSAEPALIAHWHDLLGAGQFKIGIAWQGNPDSPVERGRSMPLKALAPLARIAGVRLISLQQIHGLEQLADLPTGMVVERLDQSVDAGEDGFVDTAAIIANLDLVISTDTALAHLAGALGKPVWIALKHLPEWRWMQSRPDSPWYPTARLFRQPEIGRWDLVVADMVESLGPYVAPNG
jgi:hypothetical protein